ncbi:MAG: response regulator transcription factor [Oscillospiraceae bacterium]|nr:response regulator transcription factor [Oscillospiraceae bacterium]
MDKINIAVCDDDPVFRETLSSELTLYARQHNLDININAFSNGLELIISEINYNLIFLDYKMGIMNGLETARKLRAKNVKCPIIFISSFNEVVYDVFEVNAFRFIRKPMENHILTKAMDDFMNQFRNSSIISFNSNGKNISVNADDILYIESKGRGCIVYTDTEAYPVLQNLTLFTEVLPQEDFFRCHRNFSVNLKYVRGVEAAAVTLHNSDVIKLERSKRGALKDALITFRERKL